MFNFNNFFFYTEADFKPCSCPETPPDFWSFSGSTYWDTGTGVIRWSDHWGRGISSCNWFLDGQEFSSDYCHAGFCLYKDFKYRL